MDTVARQRVLRRRGETLTFLDLRQHMGLTGKSGQCEYVVVIRSGERVVALGVDEVIGQQEVVIKPIGSRLENIPGIAGATELADNEAALVIDATSLTAELFGMSGAA